MQNLKLILTVKSQIINLARFYSALGIVTDVIAKNVVPKYTDKAYRIGSRDSKIGAFSRLDFDRTVSAPPSLERRPITTC